jgi:DNA (cytosine-5)-methyltransferase 1/tRNA (cytosine38-C5)-methyltransferase
MRRRRFYLVASREGLRNAIPEPEKPLRPLTDYLDPAADDDPALRVPADLLRRYDGALDILDPTAPGAVTACFTAAYGRSPVRSGSYLHRKGAVRRFSPGEILRLLGFPSGFRIPASLPQAKAWHLVGNSLSVDAVRYGVRWLPLPPP